MSDSQDKFATVIGPDAVFKGQLSFDKGARLLGKFDGEISSEGELFIAEGATLTGDVQAGTVSIEGHVKGNVQAKAKVNLKAAARLEGDVQAARLEVAEGAVLIGRCVVGVNGQSAPQTTKTASAPASSVTANRAKAQERIVAGAKK